KSGSKSGSDPFFAIAWTESADVYGTRKRGLTPISCRKRGLTPVSWGTRRISSWRSVLRRRDNVLRHAKTSAHLRSEYDVSRRPAGQQPGANVLRGTGLRALPGAARVRMSALPNPSARLRVDDEPCALARDIELA